MQIGTSKKHSTKPKIFSVRHSYEDYGKKLIREDLSLKGKRDNGVANGIITKEDGSIYITYKLYKKILAAFFIKAAAKLLNGYAIDLLNGLGDLYICRIGRNPNNQKLNKGESYKLRKQLKATNTLTDDNWKIYYTDDEYIRLKWHKPSNIHNIMFYTFSPAGGQSGKGFRQLMSRSIVATPTLKALYPFIPYKPRYASI